MRQGNRRLAKTASNERVTEVGCAVAEANEQNIFLAPLVGQTTVSSVIASQRTLVATRAGIGPLVEMTDHQAHPLARRVSYRSSVDNYPMHGYDVADLGNGQYNQATLLIELV